VREILPPLPATRIPGVAGAVEGLVNMRGILLTVVDAHRLLGRPRRETDEGPIIVLDASGKTYGLIVGEVKDFVELPETAVAPRGQLPGVDPRIVRAVGSRGDEHFVILDIDALLAPMLGS
jgi:purine-binding chemotaxis protein CheW